MKPYEYRTKNQSFLSSAFVRYIALAVSKSIPKNIPANVLSIMGHLAVYGALFLSFYPIFPLQVNLNIIAILIAVQLVCDKVDGIMARRTQNDSPLGEFIDHFFELFNQGAIILIGYNVYEIARVYIVIVLTTAICLVNMSKYYEQYRTNFLVISKFSFFETKVICIIVLLFSNISGFYAFLSTPQIFGYTLIECFMAMGVFISFVLFIIKMKRIPFSTYGLWLFVIMLLLVAYVSFTSYNIIAAVSITLFYAILYVGRILFTQLVDGLEKSPDLFVPIFMALHFFTSYFDQNNTLFIVLLYLIVSVLLVIIKTARALSRYWRWRN